MAAYDPCVFFNKLGLILEVHVMGRSLQAILDFKVQFAKLFPISNEGECSWYLGMHIEQIPGEIYFHQTQYIDQIVKKYGIGDTAPVKTALDKRRDARRLHRRRMIWQGISVEGRIAQFWQQSDRARDYLCHWLCSLVRIEPNLSLPGRRGSHFCVLER
jgi:hypothetical protein